MAPWVTHDTKRNEPVLYLIVDFRQYRKDIRLYKKTDSDGNRKGYATLLPTGKRILVLRARVLPISCFPNKLKKNEHGSTWRRKENKANKYHHSKRRFPSSSPTRNRPTILLPPMQWSNVVQDPASSTNTAPVLATRVQDYSSSVSSPSLVVQATPTAPSPGDVFYNSEDQADMEFIVGVEEWRFPAHSFILDKREDTLKELFKCAEPFADCKADLETKNHFTVLRLPGLRPDIFEQMLRYIYTHQISLSSVKTALSLLQTSQTYHLPELATQCLVYISSHLTPSKVLLVLSHILQPCIESQSPCFNNDCHTHDNLQNELIFHCFQVIDCHADTILMSEEFENLEHELMVEILKRDSLEVSSESVVFDAMMRWACRTCKKQRKELTAENKSLVLGKALFLVRYLLMTHEEFIRGPVSQGVLSKEDKEILMSRIVGKTPSSSPPPLPEHWVGWKIATKRQIRNHLTVTSPSSDRISNGTNVSTTPTGSVNKPSVERKKKSMSKKLLNGVGDLVICVIHMLD